MYFSHCVSLHVAVMQTQQEQFEERKGGLAHSFRTIEKDKAGLPVVGMCSRVSSHLDE